MGRYRSEAEQVGRRGASPEAIAEAVGDESERVEGGRTFVSWGKGRSVWLYIGVV
jgi:hypothetical protein